MLIGLTGKKRSGKDSLASVLVTNHGFERVAFADALKASLLQVNPVIRIEPDERYLVSGVLGSTVETVLHARLATLVRELGWEQAKGVREVRRLLQEHGVAIREHVDESVWLDVVAGKIIDHLAAGRSVVITDVRFPNELDLIYELGGHHVHVDRPGNISTDTHVSETLLEDSYVSADWTVKNDGTLDDLAAEAATVVEVITDLDEED